MAITSHWALAEVKRYAGAVEQWKLARQVFALDIMAGKGRS